MNAITLQLQDSTHAESIEGVTSFVGEDASGSFGILPGHARLITPHVVGLARFRTNGDWTYLAVPGAVLHFHDNVLTLSARRYVLDDDYLRITRTLKQQLLTEEEKLHTIKLSLHHMEEEIFKRLWRMGRGEMG